MKFALIKEHKSIHETRVLFSPLQLQKIADCYPQHQFIIESSSTRCFSDADYAKLGFTVTKNVNDADIFLGIKEVPEEALIPYKTYFFFSHTTKMQAHNKSYLKCLTEKKITFYDHENLIDSFNKRLVAFGKSAGNIGAYHAIRTYGLKNNLFVLPKPNIFSSVDDLKNEITKYTIPNIKIVVTGTGNVGGGIANFLESIGLKQITPTEFLNAEYTFPTFTQLRKSNYLEHSITKEFCEKDFIKYPYNYESTFLKFVQHADLFIAGHYYHKDMPMLFTKKQMNHHNFKINTVADISCDLNEPIPTCIRASTPEKPIYGYDILTGTETDYKNPNSVAVMAVDNLPGELPEFSSIEFGNQFASKILPLIINNPNHTVLEKACVLKKGMFTKKYKYLEDFILLEHASCVL